MAIDRATIITGPCQLTYGGQTFWSKGDVVLKPVHARTDIATSSHGRISSRWASKTYEVTFEPSGRFTSGIAAVLWPYATTPIGSGLFGASDSPLVILGRSGDQVTLHAAALTKMPSLRLGTTLTVQGSCTFTAVLKNNVEPTAANAYYTVATGSYSDTGFDPATILTPNVASAYGAVTGFASFATQAGWEIDFGLNLSPQVVDGLGTVEMTVTDVSVSAKCIPVGPTVANVMAAMGDGLAMGSAVEAIAADLALTATGIAVTIPDAFIAEADLGWGTTRKRIGQTTWQGIRSLTTGTVNPLWTIGTGA